MVRIKLLVKSLLIPLAVGFLGSILIGGGEARTFYALLPKPPLSPPGFVFPVVWTVLYILMGISYYLMRTKAPQETVFRRVYYFQLLLNFLWTPLFFKLCWFGWALVDIGALAIVLLVMLLIMRKTSLMAMLLQLPYLLWVLFAGYINYGILSLT